MSTDQFLAEVRSTVFRELAGLDPSSLVLRLDDDVGEPSVFVIARLGGETGSVMIARIYEVDLREGALLQAVYLSDEDADVLVEALSGRPRHRREGTRARP